MSAVGKLQKHKFENCMTIDRNSWGYRRNAAYSDYLTVSEIIVQLVETVRLLRILQISVVTHFRHVIPVLSFLLHHMK